MGDDHAFAKVNGGTLDGFLDASAVQVEYRTRGKTTLHGIVRRQVAHNLARDWIFAPVGRAPAKAGETEVSDPHHVGVEQVAVVAVHFFVAERAIPVAEDIKDRALKSCDYPKEFFGGGAADIARDHNRIEGIAFRCPQFSNRGDIVMNVRKRE